jgi:hypothetical protein
MKKYFLLVTGLFCQLIALSVYAGTNPIGWSLNPSGGFPAQTVVGSTYVVTYTLTNNVPFAMPVTVTHSDVGGNFTVANDCNRTLAAKGLPNNSCKFTVTLQPIGARKNSITPILAYGRNRVPLPTLSSTSISNESSGKISGHVTSPLHPVSYVGSNYTVTFQFVNNGTATVTATQVNVTGFTASINTCTGQLNPGGAPCTVSGTFTPATEGFATLGVTYVYSGGSIPLTTTTDVRSSSGCHDISAQAVLPLPTSTFIYADNVVKYTFTNHCSTAETISGINVAANGAATVTPSTDSAFTTCSSSGTTLAGNGGNCSILVSVVPTATNSDLSITADASYNNGATHVNSTTSTLVNAIPSPTSMHTVYFVNQCNQNVWYEFANNGAIGTAQADPTPANQRSFTDYQMPAQLTGAAPSTKTLTFSAYINGGIYGRTQCNQSLGYCLTGNCVVNNTATDWSCAIGNGAMSPVTQLESYMPDTTDQDGVYDISLINGLNLPAEMKSLAPINPNNNVFTQACGQAAGAVIQPPNSILGNSTWDITPPSSLGDNQSNLVWVSAGAYDNCPGGCNPSAGSYCGMGFSSVAAVTGAGVPPLNRRCGTFQGYFQVQAFNIYPSDSDWGGGSANNLYTYYQLGNTLRGYCTMNGATATVYYMYSCPNLGQTCLLTGYNSGDPQACGCVNYNFTGSASACVSPNQDWIDRVYPRVSWLKTAAPTAYTYQYDDPSSSFTCQISGQRTSYQVTYCPAGQNGAPAY